MARPWIKTNNVEKQRTITKRRRSRHAKRRMENSVVRWCEPGLNTSQLVLGRGNSWEEAGGGSCPTKTRSACESVCLCMYVYCNNQHVIVLYESNGQTGWGNFSQSADQLVGGSTGLQQGANRRGMTTCAQMLLRSCVSKWAFATDTSRFLVTKPENSIPLI